MNLVVGNKLKLRPYQEDVIYETLASNEDTLIQVPTGGGKTFIARQISLALIVKDKQVLFVTPRKTLLEQTEEDFYGLGAQVVHGSKTYDHKHKMLISTLQTATRRKELNPDVIIIDEVHYGYSGKMIRELKDSNPKSRIIGLSATPYDKNGERLKGFGCVLDQYDMDYMIANKYLVPIFSKVLVEPNLRGIKIANNGDYDIKELGDRVGRQKLVLEIVSATLEHIKKSKKCIVFAVDINHANLLTETYSNKGIRTEVLHSELDNFEQGRTIRRFKEGDFKLLISVSMITMGFNVPDVDMAIIARPTKSQNLYKQMVGRITRLAPNKERGILLDCGSVIKNLGLPAEPIKPKEADGYSKKNTCPDCGNEKLLYRKLNGKAYWVCGHCGFKKDILKTAGYKCKQCGRMHEGKDLSFTDNKIFLNCACGHETIVSESTGREILVDITDYKMVALLEKRLLKEYKEKIIELFGVEEWHKDSIRNQYYALAKYIHISPEDVFDLDINTLITIKNKKIFSNETVNELLDRNEKESIVPKKKIIKVEPKLKKNGKRKTRQRIITFDKFTNLIIEKVESDFSNLESCDDNRFLHDIIKQSYKFIQSRYKLNRIPIVKENSFFIENSDAHTSIHYEYTTQKIIERYYSEDNRPSQEIIYCKGELESAYIFTKKIDTTSLEKRKIITKIILEKLRKKGKLMNLIYSLYFEFNSK